MDTFYFVLVVVVIVLCLGAIIIGTLFAFDVLLANYDFTRYCVAHGYNDSLRMRGNEWACVGVQEGSTVVLYITPSDVRAWLKEQ